MKNVLFVTLTILALFTSSCALTSVTTIEGKRSFILGDNAHAAYSVTLKNISFNPVSIRQKPIDGVAQAETIVKPYQKIKLYVPSNTAVIIENKSNESTSVALKVIGDTGLSMGYNK